MLNGTRSVLCSCSLRALRVLREKPGGRGKTSHKEPGDPRTHSPLLPLSPSPPLRSFPLREPRVLREKPAGRGKTSLEEPGDPRTHSPLHPLSPSPPLRSSPLRELRVLREKPGGRGKPLTKNPEIPEPAPPFSPSPKLPSSACSARNPLRYHAGMLGEATTAPPLPGWQVRPPVDGEARLLCAAVDDDEALAAVLASPELAARAAGHRLAPVLARRAVEAGLSGPAAEGWLSQLRASSAHWAVRTEILRRIGAALGQAGVPWAAIKGADLALTCYPSPGERPSSDLDVLVPEGARHEALAALTAAGFEFSGAEAPFAADFFEKDGYNYPLTAPAGVHVELHFRLWGLVPPGLTTELLDAAEPWPKLGPTAHRPRPAHALLLAAVHSWHTPRPRPLGQLLDLHLLARTGGPALLDETASAAARWGLQLPAGLAAAAAGACFGNSGLDALAARLLAGTRLPERAVLSRFLSHGEGAISIGAVFLGTLLAARPRRRGLRSILRQLWPHPHVVEQATPPHLPWPLRRLHHQLHRVTRRL